MCLSESIDLHAVNPAAINTPTTLAATKEDQLVRVNDVRALSARLAGRRKLYELTSTYGHDAFLKEAGQLKPFF